MPLPHPTPQCLHPPHELSSRLQSPLLPPLRRLPGERRDSRAQVLGGFADVRPDLLLERIRILRRPTADHALRVLDLVPHALIADRLGRLAQFARCARLIASTLARDAIGLRLELLHLGVERILLRAERPHARRAIGARRPLHAPHVLGDPLLALLRLLRVLGKPLHVAGDALVARVLYAPCGAIQFLERRIPLRFRAARRLPHLVGRALQLLRRLLELRRLLLAREPLEPTRFLFRLPRELALRAATTAARLAAHTLAHHLGLPLHALVLLLLPRRELLQPLERLIDLL